MKTYLLLLIIAMDMQLGVIYRTTVPIRIVVITQIHL